MFNGIITALITPFRDGKIDEQAYADFINWQIDQGINGFVTSGTTGEGVLLNSDEQRALLEICVQTARNRVKVLAATGAMTTEDTVRLTQQAQTCGAEGVLVITPWYVKPCQESLFEHYKSLHDATDIPIIVYNNPTRTGVNLEIETLEKMAQLKRLIGLKEANPGMDRIQRLRSLLGPNFLITAGDDTVYPTVLAMGGNGVISSTANAAPRLFVEMQQAWESSQLENFAELRDKLHQLLRAMSVASNPQPVKFATSLLGNMTLESRLPFVPLSTEARETIRNTMKSVGAWNEQPSLTVAPV